MLLMSLSQISSQSFCYQAAFCFASFFSDLKLSNITKLSKSDLLLVALTNLDILIKAFDSSTSLTLKLSIFLFSPSAYAFSMSGRIFTISIYLSTN